jgi:hypothetical protein
MTMTWEWVIRIPGYCAGWLWKHWIDICIVVVVAALATEFTSS